MVLISAQGTKRVRGLENGLEVEVAPIWECLGKDPEHIGV